MRTLSRTTKCLAVISALAAGTAAALLVGSGAIAGSSSDRAARGAAGPWRALASAPIAVGGGRTTVWTGRELLVTGSAASPDGTLGVDVALTYDPAADAWRRLPDPPSTPNYCRRTAVWTGGEMLVWGCDGVGFDPRADRWRRLPPAPVGAPGIGVWTGRELIGWGGGCCGDANADGAAYDPAENTWRRLARSPLAASQSPLGAWTGHELILFVSGLDPEGKPIEGAARAAAYRPATDTWRRIAPMPSPRRGANAVWDGRELLVVGGTDPSGRPATVGNAYNPTTNRWRSLPAMESGALQAAAVWTGKRVLLFAADRLVAYDPEIDRWSLLPSAPLERRDDAAAVWTGHELLVWGGVIGTPAGTSIPPKYPLDGAVFSERSSQGASGGGQ